MGVFLRHPSLYFREFRSWFVGCKIKTNCPLLGTGPVGGMPSVGDLFKRVLEKTKARSTSATGN